MDMKLLQFKLGLDNDVRLRRKAEELRRLSHVHFNASTFGVGEICKSVLCFELACLVLQFSFDRQKAIKYSGLSEKAYTKSFSAMQCALNLRKRLDVQELAVKFGCVRLIKATQDVLDLYKSRFIAALPEARRSSADFNRPIFTAVAFFLCARKNKLKVDRMKLIELCGTADSEFSSLCGSMADLCLDCLGNPKVKKTAKRTITDAAAVDKYLDGDSEGEDMDKENIVVLPGFKRRRKSEDFSECQEWKLALVGCKETVELSPAAAGVSLKVKQSSIYKHVNVGHHSKYGRCAESDFPSIPS